MSEQLQRQYETVVVFSPRLNDSQLKDEIKRYEGIVSSNGGTVTATENWGRKELSYLVKKERFGTFISFKYSSGKHEVPNVLGGLLRIAEPVIKFQTHVVGQPTRKIKVNPKRTTSSFDDDSVENFD